MISCTIIPDLPAARLPLSSTQEEHIMPEIAIRDPMMSGQMPVCEYSYTAGSLFFEASGQNVSDLLGGSPLLSSATDRFLKAVTGIEECSVLVDFIERHRDEFSPQASWEVLD